MNGTPEQYVSIAWTRPVKWLNFTKLPRDIDVAADNSRTIRYQRDIIRRWVKDHAGALIHEEALMELSPDRATPEAVCVIDTLRKRYPFATFLAVAFPRVNGWRPHVHLEALLAQGPFYLIDPDPYLSAEFSFDPAAHFTEWERQHDFHRAGKSRHRDEIHAVIATFDHLSLAEKAQALNERGFTSHTGKDWTKANLAKFLASSMPKSADRA